MLLIDLPRLRLRGQFAARRHRNNVDGRAACHAGALCVRGSSCEPAFRFQSSPSTVSQELRPPLLPSPAHAPKLTMAHQTHQKTRKLGSAVPVFEYFACFAVLSFRSPVIRVIRVHLSAAALAEEDSRFISLLTKGALATPFYQLSTSPNFPEHSAEIAA